MVEPLGAVGYQLDRQNQTQIRDILREAIQWNQHQRKSILINCLIGKTDFRDGSISV